VGAVSYERGTPVQNAGETWALGGAPLEPSPGRIVSKRQGRGHTRLITLVSLSLRLKDLLGPVTRVKKKRNQASSEENSWWPRWLRSKHRGTSLNSNQGVALMGHLLLTNRTLEAAPWWECATSGAPALQSYRGTSLIRNNPLLGPYSRTMVTAIWWP